MKVGLIAIFLVQFIIDFFKSGNDGIAIVRENRKNVGGQRIPYLRRYTVIQNFDDGFPVKSRASVPKQRWNTSVDFVL